MERNVLNALNEAGEALKALGEEHVSLHFFSASRTFHVGLDAGRERVSGIGETPAEAFEAAVSKRDAMADRLALEAEVRAEIERRMAEKKEAA